MVLTLEGTYIHVRTYVFIDYTCRWRGGEVLVRTYEHWNRIDVSVQDAFRIPVMSVRYPFNSHLIPTYMYMHIAHCGLPC